MNKAQTTDNTYSSTEVSPMISLVRAVACSGLVPLKLEKDKLYEFQVIGHNLIGEDNMLRAFSYDPVMLELVGAQAHTGYGSESPTGEPITILPGEGTLRFSFTRDVTAGNEWSGFVTKLKFRAKAFGETIVKLC